MYTQTGKKELLKLSNRDLIMKKTVISLIIGFILGVLLNGIYSIHPVSEGTAAYRVNKFTGDVKFYAGNKNYIIEKF